MVAVQDGEAVPGDPDGRDAVAPFALGRLRILAVGLLRDGVQVARRHLNVV